MTADARFWDDIAEQYAAKPLDDPDAYERKLAETKKRLSSGDRVLDIGCGTGSLALALAPHVAHVDAVDISAEMVRIANEKAVAAGVSNVSFHQSKLDVLEVFQPATFDTICAYNILHLVDDREAILAKMFQLLKPGGSFVVSTPCLGDSWVPYGPLITLMRWLGKAPRVVNMLRTEALEGEIASAGFVDPQRPDVGAKPRISFVLLRKPTRAWS